MQLHIVQPGDTMYSIAIRYGIPMAQLIADNPSPDPSQLVVGECLVVRFPAQTYVVQSGDTLEGIAQQYQTSVRQLWRNNPILEGETRIFPGQRLVITYEEEPDFPLTTNGYAYPGISMPLLHSTLPFLTQLTPFSYGFTPQGDLISPDDELLLEAARQYQVQPVLHLSTLTEGGSFSNTMAQQLLRSPALQARLIDQLVNTIQEKGYQGLDIDFEYIYAEDASAYAAFIRQLRAQLSPLGIPVIVALAPKTFAAQPGLLYEGHDYRALSQAADFVLLMTYEWGYTYGYVRYS